MPARSGAEYIESIKKEPPCVHLGGRRITDVTAEPIFQAPIRAIAEQYDMQRDPAYRDVMTYPSPTTGRPVSTSFLVPYSRGERHPLPRARARARPLPHPHADQPADRSQQDLRPAGRPLLHLGRVRETADGVVVRWAKMLGTMAPRTEEVAVIPFGGVAPGEDAYALA